MISAMVEALEARIAPAAVVTFTDVDGDIVKVSSSKGSTADLMSATHVTSGQLTLLDLSSATWGSEFSGASVSVKISALGAAKGDGVVNVGYIDATGIDLGSLTVNGDVGKIEIGGPGNKPAAKSIKVFSLGKLGTGTGAPDLLSNLDSSCGSLSIQGDVVGALFNVEGKLGTLFVGGSIEGQSSNSSGCITANGFNTAKIGGSILGGTEAETGALSLGNGGSITIGGSIVGGSHGMSGGLAAGNVGVVKVGGSVIGGSGTETGYLQVDKAASLSIGGSNLGRQRH